MQLKTTTLFLAALAGLAAAGRPTDQSNCRQIHGGEAARAIEEFCRKTDLVVPSDYALRGKYNGKTYVYIQGTCSPPQWVPQQYCLSQFYHMCTFGNYYAESFDQKFGRNDCQSWNIKHSGHVDVFD